MNQPIEIVVVEDNRHDAYLLMRILKKAFIDCTINWISDGAEAVKYFTENLEALPNLVFLDVQLPKYSGFEILQKIRAHEITKELNVVVLSSSNIETDIEKAYYYGANCFVTKPSDYLALKKMIPAITNFWIR